MFLAISHPIGQIRRFAAIGAVLVLAGCGGPNGGDQVYDPYETRNREVHRENVRLDRTFLRPVSKGYAASVPAPVRTGLSNAAGNLGLPRMVVNDLLQLRIGDALANTSRFVINSTVGVVGLFDPAGAIGLAERPSDFGQTMSVWGVGEGAYIELPVLGPSTERDAVGKVVDFVLDPLSPLLSAEARAARAGLGGADALNERAIYSQNIDAILYESEDSYAQARLLYLQNRRFELQSSGGEVDEAFYEDLYDE